MRITPRARWVNTQRSPESDELTHSRTYRGCRTSRRFSSIYPVHLGG